MGQKDLAQNDYYSDKVRFADACNGILFQGKQLIKPEELEEVDAEIAKELEPFVTNYKLNLLTPYIQSFHQLWLFYGGLYGMHD